MRSSLVLLLFLATATLHAAEPAAVTIETGKEEIKFLAGKELVGHYLFAPGQSRPFMKPANAPGGAPLTIARPDGSHPHHRFLWFCHGQVIPEGIDLNGRKHVDFWMESPGSGRIVCTEVGAPKLDKHQGSVVTKNEWRTAEGVKILDEARTIHLIDLGDARLLVFAIDLHASVAPVTFGDTKEGSFGVRVNEIIREGGGNGRIVSAADKTGEKDTWGHKAAWCDYSGVIDGKAVGVAIFDHPQNAHPACWHVRAYGLMAANPFGRKGAFPGQKDNPNLVKLAKGEHLNLRYGVLLHTGDAKDGNVAAHFKTFAARDYE